MNKLSSKIILPILLIAPLALVQAAPQQQSATAVILQDISSSVVNKLPKLFYNGLAEFFSKAILPTYADIAYEVDPEVPITVANNSVLSNNATAVQQAVQTDSSNAIGDAFAGISAQYQKALKASEAEIAEDDYVAGVTSINSLFGGSSSVNWLPTEQQAKAGNQSFDAQSLFGTNSYANAASLKAAQGYLSQLKSMAPPPPIIRLVANQDFDVPVQDLQDPKVTSKTIKALSADQIVNLKQALTENPGYRQYRQAYRQLIAVRSLYLSILDKFYQERVPHNGNSLLQARDEAINQRLSPDYYKAMSQASPATIAREQLFALNRISSQLNTIQKQNQTIIMFHTLDGLTKLSILTKTLDNQVKQVGKVIYCNTDQGKKDKFCKQDQLKPAAVSDSGVLPQ